MRFNNQVNIQKLITRRTNKLIIPFFLLSIMMTNLLFAQDQVSGEIQDVQVIIEKDKPLTLPVANRKYQRTNIKMIASDTFSLRYDVSPTEYKFNMYDPSFKPKAFRESPSFSKFNNYVKIGYGNLQSPLIEAFVGVSERLNHIGVWLQHESFGKGSVRGNESAFSSNEFMIDGKYVSRYFEFEPILTYRREGFYYYGYDFNSFSNSNLDNTRYFQDRALFESWSAGGILSNSGDKDLKLSFRPIYQGASMKIKEGFRFNTDNSLKLLSNISYDFKNESNVNVGFGYQWAQYDDSGNQTNRSRVFINPKVQVLRENLFVNAGMHVVYGKDTSSGFHIYPDLFAKYFLNDKYSVSLKVDGDLELNTIESLYNRNNYLDDSLVLINTNRKLGIESRLQVKLNDRFQVEAFAGFDLIENQPLFGYSEYDSSRFMLGYDDNFGQLMIGAKASYMIEEQTNITSQFTYFIYSEGSVQEAWFLPLRKLEISANHQIIKPLSIGMNLIAIGGMKAPKAGDFELKEFTSQDAIVDLGLSIDYKIKERIQLFSTANNLLNQRNEQYMNYPSRGLTAKIGFIFRF